MISDEQIIAAAGEPVAWSTTNDWGKEALVTSISSVRGAWISDSRKVANLYTADAILSAAKPLRDRIAELEANAPTMKAYYEQVFDDGGKRIAELTKQRDGLLSVMRRAVVAGAHPSIQAKEDCYNILDEALRKIAIASEKEET